MPDVTWHPVSETPPRGGRYWANIAGQWADVTDGIGQEGVCTADWYERERRWKDEYGDDVTQQVTHWAHIVYPEPPEEG